MTSPHNSQCPNYESHRLNAEDRYFEGQRVPATVTQDQDEAIIALADAEYLNCEGH